MTQQLNSHGDESHTSTGASKKRRRNSERARVTRACDRCKRRKVKCNGSQPCPLCVTAKTKCTYESLYTRGRAPIIGDASSTTLVDNGAAAVDANAFPSSNATTSPTRPDPADAPSVTQQPQEHVESLTRDQSANQTTNRWAKDGSRQGTSAFATAFSQDTSPEPSQTDLQGHYIGPASGVSFLLRVQKRLHQSVSFSSTSTIFTFGDAPLTLPEFEPSFCMMLPRDDAQHLLGRYFDFAMPTYRFLHRPTIQGYLDEFYDTLGIMHDKQTAAAKTALLFMVLAHARVYMPDDNKPGPSDLSTRYFLAAEHQLERERGSIGLTSVQARLTQCYYLLTQSRINHCWSLFGTVSHLALAIGLNRNRRPSAAGGISALEAESRRRTFWCAYTLDAYLSVALGRPRTFHDDDIDAELPACVDDDKITKDTVQYPVPTGSGAPSTMFASIAHIKLARILGRIVRELYSIKPISSSRRALITERISRDLSDWRVELTQFLDAPMFSSSLLVPIYQRQRNVLNLTYWHAIILAYRPFVLSDLARLTRRNRSDSMADSDPQIDESVKQCLSAAMSTVRTIDEITSNSQFFRAFWITSYFAFTATIVLYIFVIQKRACSPEVYSNYFVAAARCQSHLSAIAEEGSLLQRYCVVLEELRVEALRQVKRTNPNLTAASYTTAPSNDQQQQLQDQSSLGMLGAVAGWTGNRDMDAAMAMIGMFDESPSAATNYTDLLMENPGGDISDSTGMSFSGMDLVGWDQFADMVSSGLGNLDGFL